MELSPEDEGLIKLLYLGATKDELLAYLQATNLQSTKTTEENEDGDLDRCRLMCVCSPEEKENN